MFYQFIGNICFIQISENAFSFVRIIRQMGSEVHVPWSQASVGTGDVVKLRQLLECLLQVWTAKNHKTVKTETLQIVTMTVLKMEEFGFEMKFCARKTDGMADSVYLQTPLRLQLPGRVAQSVTRRTREP